MTKVSVVGMKEELEDVIQRLHSLKVMDVETYEGELERCSSLDQAERISETLVDLRSVLSKLPDVERETGEWSISEVEEEVPEINRRIEKVEEEIAGLESEISDLQEKKRFLERLRGSGVEVQNLSGTRQLESRVGSFNTDLLREEMPDSRYEVFEGDSAEAVFYQKGEEGKEAVEKTLIEDCGTFEIEREGAPGEVVSELEKEISSLKNEVDEGKGKIQDIAEEWKPELENAERFLTQKVEKAELPLEFGTTENTFVAEGWILSGSYEEFEEELAEVTDGKIQIDSVEGDNPPVKHQNPEPVKSFESLTDLMSVPKYSELDPSFIIFLTFPLFFGFMIGDAGYGLTSLIVFYAGYRIFEGARDIFKSLMYASVATIVFGLIYGDMFGFIIFGQDSALAKLTGIQLFEKIPILFHRSHHWGQVFQISALIGLLHINAGYLAGLYNEYVNHGAKEAFLEKGSWLVLQAAVGIILLVGISAGLPLLILSAFVIYLGEGIEGVIEIPSLLSNLLSYLRLFGVSVAAFSLAKVVNSFASPLFATGTLMGLAGGVLMLMLGHTFNTFIKIMEGFLQGIRLHYVEMFSKFYEGGGRKYVPFGSDIK